jgi:hypothetical protein
MVTDSISAAFSLHMIFLYYFHSMNFILDPLVQLHFEPGRSLVMTLYYQEMALASAEPSPSIKSVIDFGPFVECKS